MADPLNSLRASINSSTPPKPADANSAPVESLAAASHITLSGIVLPKDTVTRFRKSTSSPATDGYTLAALYTVWHLRDAAAAEYMRQTREAGVTSFVSITERKGVVDWLEGRKTEDERIAPLTTAGDTTTPPGSPPPTFTTLGGKRPATGPISPSKRRYVANPADAAIVKKICAAEMELQDRNSVLRGQKINNFSGLLTTFQNRLKKIHETSKSGLPATITPTPDAKLQAKKAKHNYPIIMVSSSPTALITMYNVKRFLQDAVFESSSEARARANAEGNLKPEDMIPIYRQRPEGPPGRYFVIDGADALAKFGTDAWDRVVCVMTTGQAWQFKPYKWTEPRELFHHVKGIYVTWSTDPPNTKIKDWNVTELKIDKNRRHVDKAVVAQFWKLLDSWTAANKPGLMKT